MRNEWHNLSWLSPAPADFTALCKAVMSGDGDALRRLAGFQLSDLQLTRLARVCASFAAPPPGFEPFRLAVLGNANSEFAAAALKASALRYGVWLETHIEGLGQTATAALDPAGTLYEFNPSAVLLVLTYHVLPAFTPGNNDALEGLKSEVILIRDALRQNGNISLVVQTIPQAPISVFGNIDRRVAGTIRRQVAAFNDWLFTTDIAVLDVAALAETAGLSSWHNSGQWHWAKLPFAQNLLPLYADYAARFIGAMRGRSRKCLVLDLDNTLWGGVIGDDGLEGIELGQGSPRGEAFLAIQQMALALRARGVVLAVCSKNEEGNARLPFREHPEQLLKESHIAVFQANWNDKASNLEAIARALDLTPESLVFLDDNPAEREIVRRELPAVAVPEIPADEPALWPMILSAAGYFESVAFTEADLERADQYASNVQRESLKVQSRDIGDYLKALGMTMEITGFTLPVQARVAQLINRSNQYNLTVRRYTEEQVAALEKDSAAACFSARLRDRFGDNGIISIIICRDEGDVWYIDTWLMSCRVLGRQVERALLAHVAAAARAASKKALKGHYIPGPKNKMVEHHYEALGFQKSSEGENGESFWSLDLASYVPAETPIEIVSDEDTRRRA